MQDVTSFGQLSMFVVAFQFAFQPYLIHWFLQTMPKSTFYILQESFKILIGVSTLSLGGKMAEQWDIWKLKECIRLAFVPAGLYVIQNLSNLAAAERIDGLTFNVLNQTKVIFSAIFLDVLCIKRHTWKQYFGLFILFTAAAIMTASDLKSSSNSGIDEEWKWGIIYAMVGASLSGLNSALIQQALQALDRNSIVLTIELAVFGIFFLSLRAAYGNFFNDERVPLLPTKDIDWKCYFPIFTNAIGGVFVGFVTKYAGSIYKGYALAFGICISMVIRSLTGTMSPLIFVAIPLVIISLYIYNNYGHQKQQTESFEQLESESDSDTEDYLEKKQLTRVEMQKTKEDLSGLSDVESPLAAGPIGTAI